MLIAVFVIYLLGGILWTRLWFRRRCGVRFQSGTHGLFVTGQATALFAGLAWPVTMFTSWRPDPCNHRSHVLERHELVEQYERENARTEAAQRRQQAR